MPAVRMISVWPMAMTPTTITCCRISEKFSPVKKRSVVVPKIAQATASAMKGPSWPMGGSFMSFTEAGGVFRADAAEPASPGRWRRPLGGSGAAATGGSSFTPAQRRRRT